MMSSEKKRFECIILFLDLAACKIVYVLFIINLFILLRKRSESSLNPENGVILKPNPYNAIAFTRY